MKITITAQAKIDCSLCERGMTHSQSTEDLDRFRVQEVYIEATEAFESNGWIRKAGGNWECPWHTDAARRAA